MEKEIADNIIGVPAEAVSTNNTKAQELTSASLAIGTSEPKKECNQQLMPAPRQIWRNVAPTNEITEANRVEIERLYKKDGININKVVCTIDDVCRGIKGVIIYKFIRVLSEVISYQTKKSNVPMEEWDGRFYFNATDFARRMYNKDRVQTKWVNEINQVVKEITKYPIPVSGTNLCMPLIEVTNITENANKQVYRAAMAHPLFKHYLSSGELNYIYALPQKCLDGKVKTEWGLALVFCLEAMRNTENEKNSIRKAYKDGKYVTKKVNINDILERIAPEYSSTNRKDKKGGSQKRRIIKAILDLLNNELADPSIGITMPKTASIVGDNFVWAWSPNFLQEIGRK